MTTKAKPVNLNVKGILMYHSLIEPRENLRGVLEYSATLLIPKTNIELINKIEEATNKALDSFFGLKKPSEIKKPLRDGDLQVKKELEKDVEEQNKTKLRLFPGHYTLQAKNAAKEPGVLPQYKPCFVDPSGTRKFETSEEIQKHIYSGALVVLSTTLFGYSQSGNNGVGCYLKNVQFVKHGEKLGYTPGDEFEDVSDEGFVEQQDI